MKPYPGRLFGVFWNEAFFGRKTKGEIYWGVRSPLPKRYRSFGGDKPTPQITAQCAYLMKSFFLLLGVCSYLGSILAFDCDVVVSEPLTLRTQWALRQGFT